MYEKIPSPVIDAQSETTPIKAETNPSASSTAQEVPTPKETLFENAGKYKEFIGRQGLAQGFDTTVKIINELALRRGELTPEEAQRAIDLGSAVREGVVEGGSVELFNQIDERGTFQVLSQAQELLHEIVQKEKEKEAQIRAAQEKVNQAYQPRPELKPQLVEEAAPMSEQTRAKLNSIYGSPRRSFSERVRSLFGW